MLAGQVRILEVNYEPKEGQRPKLTSVSYQFCDRNGVVVPSITYESFGDLYKMHNLFIRSGEETQILHLQNF